MRKKMVITGIVILTCLLAGCTEAIEIPYPNIVDLMLGSAGFAGDGEILGLQNGNYLIRHEKKTIHQEKDPVGKIRLWHDEDWYSVENSIDAESGNTISKITWLASSASRIPEIVTTDRVGEASNPLGLTSLPMAPGVNTITGLTNGEKYSVYFYGAVNNGQRVGRTWNAPDGDLGTGGPLVLATLNYNTVVDIRGLNTNQSIQLLDQFSNTNSRSGVFVADFNHIIVLVNTPLHWTEFKQTIYQKDGATILLQGEEFNIEIRMRYDRGYVSVAPIEEEGQKYFILTGDSEFRGYITRRAKG